MGRLGFVYDRTRCIGCNACQMACKDCHELELGQFFRRVETREYEKNGKTIVMHYSGSCNHCENAACVKNCPTGAMHFNEDGTVGHDAAQCIGCGTCTWACPYGEPKLSHKTGRAMKCDSCIDRRQEGRDPACVEACITHCLRFGDIETLTKEMPTAYVNKLDILPPATLTNPSLRVKKEGKE